METWADIAWRMDRTVSSPCHLGNRFESGGEPLAAWALSSARWIWPPPTGIWHCATAHLVLPDEARETAKLLVSLFAWQLREWPRCRILHGHWDQGPRRVEISQINPLSSIKCLLSRNNGARRSGAIDRLSKPLGAMLETLQPAAYGASFAFFALSLTTTILRIYSRKCIIKSFGRDDWWMVFVFVRSPVAPMQEQASNLHSRYSTQPSRACSASFSTTAVDCS